MVCTVFEQGNGWVFAPFQPNRQQGIAIVDVRLPAEEIHDQMESYDEDQKSENKRNHNIVSFVFSF